MRREQHLLDLSVAQVAISVDVPRHMRAMMVWAHGLTGDRVGPAFLLRRLALRCALEEVVVVRVDLPGSGDSTEDFYAVGVTDMSSALVEVTKWATARFDLPLFLAGISTGGVVATLAMKSAANTIGLVLLSSDLLEMPMTPQDAAVRLGEFHLSPMFLRDRADVKPRRALSGIVTPVLLVVGSDDKQMLTELPSLRTGVTVHEVRGAGHLFESDESFEELSSVVTQFLRDVIGRSASPRARAT